MKIPLCSDEPLFRFEILNVAPSWHCDAGCRHCFLPRDLRRRDNFHKELIEAALGSVPEVIKLVSFTGGEPFLHPRRLVRLMRIVSRGGRRSTVVTNGLWTQDAKRARRTLRACFDAGLRGISISLDDYHRPRVAPAQVIALLTYAKSLGMSVNVKGVGRKALAGLRRMEATGLLNGQEHSATSVSLDRVGTARGLQPDRVRKSIVAACPYVLQPLLEPNGDVFACCSCWSLHIDNPVLFRGNVADRPMADILDEMMRDYLLAALLTSGPAGVRDFISPGPPAPFESRCQLCVDTLNDRVLLKRLQERIAGDLQVRKEIAGRAMLFGACHQPEVLPMLVES